MNATKREDLIHSLANSMGLVDTHDTKYSTAHYDEATGTFYCEGIPLPHSSMERILDWYRKQMNAYKDRLQKDREAMEFYMRYTVAYNAILLMQDRLNMK